MSLNSLAKYLTLALFLGCLLSSCKDDMPDEREMFIDPGFELNSTWFFQTVSGVGVIGGVDQVDDDPNPTGFITFNADGTGYSEFSINLLNMPYGKTENITWERQADNIVDIIGVDGKADTWTLIRANDDVVEADWTVDFGPQNNAVFTAVLTPTP